MAETRNAPTATADWLQDGQGQHPAVRWSFVTEGPLTALSLARESGETFVADSTGMLCRLDRQGRMAAITRLEQPARVLSWSDAGQFGVALCGDATLLFFDHVFKSPWKVELKEVGLTAAISPFGSHVVAGCADAVNHVYDAGKKRLATFETIRPLSFVQFLSEEPEFIAAAEHGLVCRHRLSGEELWNEKLWSNVGQLSITGDASRIHLACFTHGVQVYKGDGTNAGSYVLDGTVSRAAASFEPHRLIAATVERAVYWINSDGALLWSATAPDDIAAVQCDALGEFAVVGFASGRVVRLDWRKGEEPAGGSKRR